MSKSGPYLHGHHASVLRSHTWRTVENSCSHLLPYLDPSKALRILDVGCGPGTITTDFASRIPNGTVIGIDPAASVIETARVHAQEKRISNVHFATGDIFDLDGLKTLDFGPGIKIEGGSFDIVHAHQVLQHLQDPVAAVEAMATLVKPGGVIALRESDYQAMTWYPEVPGLRAWQDIYMATARSIGCDPNIGRRVHAVAMEAGFARRDIDAGASTWVFSTAEERAWWCGLWAERTVKSDFRRRCEEVGLLVRGDELERVVEAWRELEGCEEGWFSVTSGEVIVHVK